MPGVNEVMCLRIRIYSFHKGGLLVRRCILRVLGFPFQVDHVEKAKALGERVGSDERVGCCGLGGISAADDEHLPVANRLACM